MLIFTNISFNFSPNKLLSIWLISLESRNYKRGEEGLTLRSDHKPLLWFFLFSKGQKSERHQKTLLGKPCFTGPEGSFFTSSAPPTACRGAEAGVGQLPQVSQ